MSYFHGLGAIEQGSQWQLRSGVAIPLTSTMLGYFQGIQRAINAINAKQKRALVSVDGRIGPKTVDALSSIVWTNSSDPWANTLITATFVGENAPTILSELLSLMERLGATYVADPSSSSAPSTVKPDGTIDNPPDTDTTKLVIAAIAIGAVVALVAKKKRKKR